jgi:transcriptional regulator with XRE-family HTH domain
MSTPAERYLRLIAAMKEQLAGAFGWQAEVARRLGVTRAAISRLARGAQSQARPETIDRAIERLGLERNFFYGPTEPTPEEYEKAAGPSTSGRVQRAKTPPEVSKLEELAQQAARVMTRTDDDAQVDEQAEAEMLEIARAVLRQPLPRRAQAVLDSSDRAARRASFAELCARLYAGTLR